MKPKHALLFFALALLSLQANAQKKIYHSNGFEFILSGADVKFNDVNVNTNMRFTLFFHTQQHVNLDFNDHFGLFTGIGIRNVGFIVEDQYQNVGFSDIGPEHQNWNKNTKIKRRSYSLGFPLAFKVGSFDKHFFFFAGGEYEWMLHYKQKQFLDGNKVVFKEWNSNRVNTWIPSLFAGVQFPQGFRLKFKYYMEDFLNTDFEGVDFGQPVDYSDFQSTGMWYVSMAFFINKKQLEKLRSGTVFEKSAYNY
jgi:hypothetical protein